MPSEDVAAAVETCAMATKVSLPKVMAIHAAAVGSVLDVHVMPSGDDAAIVPVPKVLETATKVPLPYATDVHAEEIGSVRAVHVTPSGDVAAAVEPFAIATKTPFP